MPVFVKSVHQSNIPNSALAGRAYDKLSEALTEANQSVLKKLSPQNIVNTQMQWARLIKSANLSNFDSMSVEEIASRLNPFLPPPNQPAVEPILPMQYRRDIVAVYNRFNVKYNEDTFPWQGTEESVQNVLRRYKADPKSKARQTEFVRTFFQQPIFPVKGDAFQVLLADNVLQANRTHLGDTAFPKFSRKSRGNAVAGVQGSPKTIFESDKPVRWFVNGKALKTGTSYELDLKSLGQHGVVKAAWKMFHWSWKIHVVPRLNIEARDGGHKITVVAADRDVVEGLSCHPEIAYWQKPSESSGWHKMPSNELPTVENPYNVRCVYETDARPIYSSLVSSESVVIHLVRHVPVQEKENDEKYRFIKRVKSVSNAIFNPKRDGTQNILRTGVDNRLVDKIMRWNDLGYIDDDGSVVDEDSILENAGRGSQKYVDQKALALAKTGLAADGSHVEIDCEVASLERVAETPQEVNAQEVAKRNADINDLQRETLQISESESESESEDDVVETEKESSDTEVISDVPLAIGIPVEDDEKPVVDAIPATPPPIPEMPQWLPNGIYRQGGTDHFIYVTKDGSLRTLISSVEKTGNLVALNMNEETAKEWGLDNWYLVAVNPDFSNYKARKVLIDSVLERNQPAEARFEETTGVLQLSDESDEEVEDLAEEASELEESKANHEISLTQQVVMDVSDKEMDSETEEVADNEIEPETQQVVMEISDKEAESEQADIEVSESDVEEAQQPEILAPLYKDDVKNLFENIPVNTSVAFESDGDEAWSSSDDEGWSSSTHSEADLAAGVKPVNTVSEAESESWASTTDSERKVKSSTSDSMWHSTTSASETDEWENSDDEA